MITTARTESMKFNDHPNVKFLGSIPEMFDYVNDENHKINEVNLIGGAHLCKNVIEQHQDLIKNVFLTRVYKDVHCDVFMPKNWLDPYRIIEISQTKSQNDINYDFCRYINPSLAGSHYEEFFQQKIFKDRHNEYEYLELIEKIIRNGVEKSDRTGTGTLSLFGNIMRFNLQESFPLLTTKRVYWKGVVEELLWFLRGQTDGKILAEKNVKIWDGNGSREFLDKLGFVNRDAGDLGPVYGFQWRHFGAEYKDCYTDYTGQGIDQIQEVIDMIKSDPSSRRLIVCAWNPSDLKKMA